ncbi:MAG: hypothetical protein U9R29_09015 [Thermodesulfobacteriota bacterium]|nr:hypothetical protein [Thermodesulfobacteriota bacterium]
MKFRLIGVMAVVLLCMSSLPVTAEVIDLVKKDFTAESGYVVMPAGGEYIIDLDAVQGITAGDLLAVVEQGDAIVHPVTGKVLGTMDKTVAVLQVSRVKSGYSYASAVSGDTAKIQAGTKIDRFSNLSAVYRDETGTNEVLFAKLKAALPLLQWQVSSSATMADLFFTATPSGLQVRDSKGQLIRAYAPEKLVNVTANHTSATIPTSGVTSAVNYASAPHASSPIAVQPVVQGAVTYQQSTRASHYTGSALNMEFPRFTKVGQFDKTTVMADFATIDGQLLMATMDAGAIQVFAVSDKLTRVAVGDSATLGQILALSWYQPRAGQVYLAVTVWTDNRIGSDLLQLQGDQLVPVVRDYEALIAAFDMDGDGRSEQLLSQSFSREAFYGSRVRELSIDGNRFAATKTSLVLPPSFRIFGALFADVTGNGQAETVFVRNRRLYIYSAKEQLYKSSKELGASISSITYDVDPDAQNPMIATASCDVAPIAADLDGDGVREIVAIAAEGNMLRSVGVASAIDKSWLAVFKYRNGMVMKGTLGDKLERSMQGLAVANGQAFMVATDVAGLLDDNSASYVLAVPVK